MTPEEKLKAENAELKIRYREALRTIAPVRQALQIIVDGIEEEGDRTYFGSTNDADRLKRIVERMDLTEWEEHLEPIAKLSKDLHPFDEVSLERDKLRGQVETLEKANNMYLAALNAFSDALELLLPPERRPKL